MPIYYLISYIEEVGKDNATWEGLKEYKNKFKNKN